MEPALLYRQATPADTALLATMNQHSIEDEGHRNPMTLPELEVRMWDLLPEKYEATIFERGGRAVAYALWRDEPAYVIRVNSSSTGRSGAKALGDKRSWRSPAESGSQASESVSTC